MSEDFEAQLRGALRRQEPSAGFAERVIAKTSVPKRGKRAWVVVLAMAAMLAIAFLANREYKQRRAAEAHRQAVVALRITAEKLNLVRNKMMTRQARVAETENP